MDDSDQELGREASVVDWANRHHEDHGRVVNPEISFTMSPACTSHRRSTKRGSSERLPYPSIPEQDFVHRAFKHAPPLYGCTMLGLWPELGWVECAMGKTRPPPPERPFEGMLTIHSELFPIAASEYKFGRLSEEEVTVTPMLDKLLWRSDAADKEPVWHIPFTIHVLADAGNMVDCACLAGIVAPKHFRRPKAEGEGEELTVHPPSERAPVPLSMPRTQAFYPDSDTPPLPDPLHLQETLSEGLLTVALNAQREPCVAQKATGIYRIVEAQLVVDWRGTNVEVR
ncbi:ribosomal protein S5 domain 2-like protein [Epithele typhae]|uniref:ribosomal protein S5 domain 2-like protein n=1 Tax=Epithele typhae TaxID=378194 RepID=UPI0020083655|nr:ribosomal protein S5 domain 2-like protein [Epithele typhae]KAH9938788.1 ribosomal protein S5 domain 2-like protein [Epithele typhae]